MSQIDITNTYKTNVKDLKYYHVFGIFCTLIGIILIIPKISTYYKKQTKKPIKRTEDRTENIFVILGTLFFVYGIKEIFFRNPTDIEISFNQLLFYLRGKDVLNSEIYSKLSSYQNTSVLEHLN